MRKHAQEKITWHTTCIYWHQKSVSKQEVSVCASVCVFLMECAGDSLNRKQMLPVLLYDRSLVLLQEWASERSCLNSTHTLACKHSQTPQISLFRALNGSESSDVHVH